MCGINVIYGVTDEFRSRDLMSHMNKCVEHRGPDDAGIFFEPGIVLGHRRLSIIDLSSGARQPMTSADGRFVLSYNGEIYNFQELKKLVPNYEFRTSSDSEVILALWEKFGKQCIEKLDGMFAIAIWDREEKKLILTRDRFGKKPIYYTRVGDNYLFSSEIRALISTGLFEPKLSRSGLSNYLLYQTVFTENTILENVQMMPAASIWELDKEGIKKDIYWSTDRAEKKYKLMGPYARVKEEVNDLFFKAVEKRMVADVPLGAFLSGGIDSSCIVAAMSKIARNRVKTFTVNFDEAEFSEAGYARLVAEKFKTDHHEINLRSEDFLAEVTNALDAMDHPSCDGVNSYVVSKYTRNAGITVALSGVGSDELFGGYPVFRYLNNIYKRKIIQRSPQNVRKLFLGSVSRLLPKGQAEKMEAIGNSNSMEIEALYPIFREVMSRKDLKASGNEGGDFMQKKFSPVDGNKVITAVSKYEIEYYLQNVLLRDTDQMSMAVSLEVRAPFLDTQLAEYVLSLPDSFKPIKPQKKLLIDCMGDLLPREVWDRKKMGFVFPWKYWVNNELKEFCAEHIQYLGDHGLISEKYMLRLLQSLEGPENENGYGLWNFVVLGYWLNKNKIKIGKA